MHGFGLRTFHRWHGGSPVLANQRGATLIELLIASVIGLIVVASAFEIYLTQHRNWIIQDEVTDTQQAVRASIRMLSKHIRMAGHGLPQIAEPIVAFDSNPDTILIMYEPAEGCDVPIEHDMPQPSSELRCDGHDISCFKEDTWGYIYDPMADTGEFFFITQVQVAASHIQHNAALNAQLSRCYPKGSQVYQVEAYRFYIDQSDSLHPMLITEEMGQQPEPYADNIEDLQFRYVMQNGDTLDVPNQSRLVRRVLITVIGRTDRTDLQFEGEYRRRGFATEVLVRNLNL